MQIAATAIIATFTLMTICRQQHSTDSVARTLLRGMADVLEILAVGDIGAKASTTRATAPQSTPYSLERLASDYSTLYSYFSVAGFFPHFLNRTDTSSTYTCPVTLLCFPTGVYIRDYDIEDKFPSFGRTTAPSSRALNDIRTLESVSKKLKMHMLWSYDKREENKRAVVRSHGMSFKENEDPLVFVHVDLTSSKERFVFTKLVEMSFSHLRRAEYRIGVTVAHSDSD